MDRAGVVRRLERAGCIAAAEEAAMVLQRAAGDEARMEELLARRETGEPIEWIVGWAPFCGLRLSVAPGVYVPRAQTEVLARQAAARLRPSGVAVDLATGCGAVARVLAAVDPSVRVCATELDPVAAACARSNGVEVFEGDLDVPLPRSLLGTVDVLTANVPYVPTSALRLLPRDVVAHEPRAALDGGADGLDLVRRVLGRASTWLRPGTGRVLVEIGPDQAAHFPGATFHEDDEGDVRALELTHEELSGA